MKKIFFIVMIALISSTIPVNAQSAESVAMQDTDTSAVDVTKPKTGKFQYGVSLRYGSSFFLSTEEAVILSGGYRFNKRNYVGLNVGVAKVEDVLRWEKSDNGKEPIKYMGCPISLDYIHYFPLGKAKKHAILVGAEGGLICSFGKSYIGTYQDYMRDENIFTTPIAIIKAGMEHQVYKRLHINWGVRIGILALGVSLGVNI